LAENEELRRRLAESDLRQAVSHVPRPEANRETENLSAENELLRESLEEHKRLLEEVRQHANGTEPVDLDSYEAELNQYRQQLEQDRARLNAEIEQLRTRNKELDEATREMEMEMSRERAELARERTRLDRLRDEVRVESERLQREANVRDTLAPVQKLREALRR